MLVQSFTERVRVLVGMKRWDYIVLWKLSNDERCIEWMDCCCGGSERLMDNINGDEDSTNLPCRDIMFPHPRITSCHLLDQLPSSMLLDSSGVHAQAFLSHQPTWLNITSSQDTIATRVLIPLSLGLLELFVTKHVPEDEEMVDFIRAQCNLFIEQQTMNLDSFSSDHQKDHHQLSLYQQQQIPCDLPNDISVERIHLCNSPLNNSFFMEESNMFLQESESNNMMSSSSKGGSRWMEPTDDQINDHSFMCENNRSDDSDPNDEEDDIKCGSRRRSGKGPQSKNLEAERKRRKKLNDRLYTLRSLVPNISKLDRASILGDAIEYVKELQKQAEDLKVELEEQSDDEENTRKTPQDDTHETTKLGPKREHDNYLTGYHHKGSPNNEKVQLMEPQVEVFQLDGNDFFVKVFCEHKSGGFVRLMEALNSLGLEVANVNTTRHTCLVSTIFKVERKNDETVEADDVKESLLELTRNPSRMWHTNPNSAESESQNVDNEFSIDHNQTHLHCRQINPHHHQR